VLVDSGNNSSEGMRVEVINEDARDVWRYLERRADVPSLERDDDIVEGA